MSPPRGRSSALPLVRRLGPVLLALPFVLLAFSSAIVAYDDHLEPCLLILERGTLPAVDECWECHQPPLYYALGAALLSFVRDDTGEVPASRAFQTLKLLNLLFSLATIALLSALARRFFAAAAGPGRPLQELLVLSVVLLTPVFLLSSLMMGNDAAVLFFCVLFCWLTAPRAPSDLPLTYGRAALLGAVAGAAVLAKYNAFALVPVGIAVVLWRGYHARTPATGNLGRLAVAAALFLAVSAPWFVRNLIVSGTPIPTRMATAETVRSERYDLFALRPVGLLRTPFLLAERTRPGDTLPYLDHQVMTPVDLSLWTKVYAGFWSDSLYYLQQPPPAWTALRYLLALPVTLLALFGLVIAARWLLARRGAEGAAAPDLVQSSAMVAPVALVASLLALFFAFVARYPWVRLGHGRASFLLPLLVPFALGLAMGLAALLRGRSRAATWAAAAPLALLVASCAHYALFLVASYW